MPRLSGDFQVFMKFDLMEKDREEFKEACRRDGQSAAAVLRFIVKEYVRLQKEEEQENKPPG